VGGARPRGGARGRAHGPAGSSPYPFDDDGGGGESAVSYERDDRNTRGFGLDEADCFGRAPSPRRHRPNWQHESHFSFADEGANANDSRLASDAKRAAAARNLARTASLDARAQEEDRFRTLKARGPEYAWARRGVATADPNALWGSRDESDESEGGFAKKEKRGGRALGPRRDAATLEAEREARVVGVEWGSTPPPGSSRDGNPKPKSDAWGLSPESVGAIQLGAGVYREYPGADVLENEDALDSAPPRFVDPRASEKAAHEKALYASTAARFGDATMEELSANRARCEAGGAGRVLGHFLYEARGEEETETRNAAAAREGAARARPPSPKRAGPENSEKTDMFGVLAGG
jgi:hypothetical protein